MQVLLFALCALLVAAICAALAVAIALGASAKRADAADDAELEMIRLSARLTALGRVRSPSGRRFYPTPQARRELAESVSTLFSSLRT
jgi:hypothetical protein